MNELKSSKQKNRKIILIVLSVITVLLVLLTVAYFILSAIASREPDYGYEFYAPVWDSEKMEYGPDWSTTLSDITSEEDYAETGWYITYVNDMGEAVMILDDDYLRHGIGVEYLSYYFAAIQAGDHETYNAMFGDEYYKDHKPVDEFTPQRIYDITVRLLNEAELDDETDVINYEISYKIMRNDGTFRRDIGSDMARTQYLTVTVTTDDIYISGLTSVFAK